MTIDELGAERYLLLTTYRTTGVGVPTAVWAVLDADGPGAPALLVGTGAEAGKTKRIRANGRATLQPCDMRGTPTPGSESLEARAVVESDAAAAERAEQLLRKKYGLQYRLIALRRSRSRDRAILRITAP